MADETTVRRVVLVEVDSTRRWSSADMEQLFLDRVPELRPVVFGSVAGGEVDATFRKIRQLARETEEGATLGDRVHSAGKAISFFREMWPTRLWNWWEIGVPQRRRGALLKNEADCG